LIMTIITITDARIRFIEDPSAFYRFIIIAVVLFILVYNIASSIVLYWTTSNLIALILSLKRRSRLSSSGQ
jgi:membrane protein insertase Oxa1/YidC/SpoIIIJ